MKPERRGSRGELAAHAGGAHWKGAERAGKADGEVVQEIAADFTTEELLEFLEADGAAEQADPDFRERLRDELWELVQSLRRRGR